MIINAGIANKRIVKRLVITVSPFNLKLKQPFVFTKYVIQFFINLNPDFVFNFNIEINRNRLPGDDLYLWRTRTGEQNATEYKTVPEQVNSHNRFPY